MSKTPIDPALYDEATRICEETACTRCGKMLDA